MTEFGDAAGAPARPLQLASASEAETIDLGRALGRVIAAGDVVLLQGELGAGKTRMVEGIASGLGAPDETRSPTFVLVNEYVGRLKLAHCDLYRLEGLDDTSELGLDDYLDGRAAVAVEWPERARAAFPDDALEIQIEYGAGPEDRQLAVVATGPRSARLLAALRVALAAGASACNEGR